MIDIRREGRSAVWEIRGPVKRTTPKYKHECLAFDRRRRPNNENNTSFWQSESAWCFEARLRRLTANCKPLKRSRLDHASAGQSAAALPSLRP